MSESFHIYFHANMSYSFTLSGIKQTVQMSKVGDLIFPNTTITIFEYTSNTEF